MDKLMRFWEPTMLMLFLAGVAYFYIAFCSGSHPEEHLQISPQEFAKLKLLENKWTKKEMTSHKKSH